MQTLIIEDLTETYKTEKPLNKETEKFLLEKIDYLEKMFSVQMSEV